MPDACSLKVIVVTALRRLFGPLLEWCRSAQQNQKSLRSAECGSSNPVPGLEPVRAEATSGRADDKRLAK
jgi:hypothetical protein